MWYNNYNKQAHDVIIMNLSYNVVIDWGTGGQDCWTAQGAYVSHDIN